MQVKDYFIRILRKSVHLILRKKFILPDCIKDRQNANDIIYDYLMGLDKCMISRFGTTELITVNNYLCIKSKDKYIKKLFNYITDKTHTPWWYRDHFKSMKECSGIFPPSEETSIRFSKRYLEDIPLIDIIGSFQYYEKFMPLKNNIISLHLETLYPFFVNRPWTLALKGKKILVVHPFEETIISQYQKRNFLFSNKDILPDFDLIVYKAIQSVSDCEVPYNDWFEALNTMEKDINEIDFDICLLGCGAYGLPLAASIKRNGKKAFHIGGGLQLLFGIKGKRWDRDDYGKEHNLPFLFEKPYKSLYNEYWVRPSLSETPNNVEKADRASYW